MINPKEIKIGDLIWHSVYDGPHIKRELCLVLTDYCYDFARVYFPGRGEASLAYFAVKRYWEKI